MIGYFCNMMQQYLKLWTRTVSWSLNNMHSIHRTALLYLAVLRIRFDMIRIRLFLHFFIILMSSRPHQKGSLAPQKMNSSQCLFKQPSFLIKIASHGQHLYRLFYIYKLKDKCNVTKKLIKNCHAIFVINIHVTLLNKLY